MVTLFIVDWTIIFLGSFCTMVLSCVKPPQAGENQNGKLKFPTDRTTSKHKKVT